MMATQSLPGQNVQALKEIVSRMPTTHEVTAGPLVTESPAPLRPLFKTPGGKGWLVPYLKTLYDRFPEAALVEPFCGALNVALGLRPKRAVLNDNNPHVINFYRQIRSGNWRLAGDTGMAAGMTARILRGDPLTNTAQTYLEIREAFNVLVGIGRPTLTSGAYYYWLNRHCFNGLHRFNRFGRFNVPYGKYEKVNLLSDFSPYETQFKGWGFWDQDFEKTPMGGMGLPFIYADPPYDDGFTAYTKESFSWADQERLAKWLQRFANQDLPVVASNLATPRIMEMYQDLGFLCHLIEAPRRIACNGDRKPVIEMLAVSKELA